MNLFKLKHWLFQAGVRYPPGTVLLLEPEDAALAMAEAVADHPAPIESAPPPAANAIAATAGPISAPAPQPPKGQRR